MERAIPETLPKMAFRERFFADEDLGYFLVAWKFILSIQNVRENVLFSLVTAFLFVQEHFSEQSVFITFLILESLDDYFLYIRDILDIVFVRFPFLPLLPFF